MTRTKKKKPKYDADRRHAQATFCGLVSFVRMSATMANDIAEEIQCDDREGIVDQLEELAAEAEVLRRLALDAIDAAAKYK